MVHHVACQTDTPQLCTAGTQLSIKTLRPHYKSSGLMIQILYSVKSFILFLWYFQVVIAILFFYLYYSTISKCLLLCYIGTQTTMSWPDIGLGSSQPLLSSTPIKRPIKRPRLELEEEEEDPFGGSSSANVEQPSDSIYDPADSVTTLTEPTDMM